MLKVTVIGSGNVALHLVNAITASYGATVVQVLARRPDSLKNISGTVHIISDALGLKEADIYIIAVSDNAIKEVSSALPFTNKLVVHTSGTMPVDILDNKNRRGVFYPLQTFSKSRKIDFLQVPLCLESENENDYILLKQLANMLSYNVFKISSLQRISLHVAAVFASNFSNHMYTLANNICTDNNIPFSILNPLILETAKKIQELTPAQAQTGPAVRHDHNTINSHLEFINDANMKAIYTLLTQSIQNTNGQKL